MTRRDLVHILIEPQNPTFLSTGAPNPSQRTFDAYDRFAAELQVETSSAVDIIECRLEEAPTDGMLLVAYHPVMRESFLTSPSWRRRPLILLNVRYSDAKALVEPLQPAGVVLSDRYRRWVHRQDAAILTQICGLKLLGPSLAPTLLPEIPSETEHFCMYESRDAISLPAMLAGYIAAYWQYAREHQRV